MKDDDGNRLGFVYLAEEPTVGILKIGFTQSAASRAKSLRTAHGEYTRIVYCFAGSVADEAAAHEKWRAFHANGEWFCDEPVIREWFASHPNAVPIDDAEIPYEDRERRSWVSWLNEGEVDDLALADTRYAVASAKIETLRKRAEHRRRVAQREG